jgi:uncharacterized protein YmfQ (DUF2313 family)
MIVLSLLALFSVGVSAVSMQTANAANPITDFFCGLSGGIGLNTQYRDFGGGILDANQKTDNTAKMSMLDLYGDSLNWTTYNGTPKPDKIPGGSGNIFGLDADVYQADQNDTLVKSSEKSHAVVKCITQPLISMIAGTILGTANMVSSISSYFVTKAVDPDFICQDANNSAGVSCINLLAVIGGTGAAGSDGGIIGRLYSGLYQGLIILIWAIVGVWVAWTGLAKRKLTTALGGVFGAFIIFGAGVIALNNPLLLAQAPMRIGTTVGGCVVQGINGVNCMSSNSSDPNGEPSTNTECYVDDAKSVDVSRSLSLVARQSTCSIWKAFVLEPWSVGQFGASYESLYYQQGGTTGQIFQNKYTKDVLSKNWGDSGSDSSATLGVSMYASDSNPMSTCSASSSKFTYKNLALYQLNLQSSLHNCNGAVNSKYHSTKQLNYQSGSNTYADWYWMVMTMNATNASAGKGTDDISYMWNNWTGDNAFSRIGVGLIALIASVCGALILVSTSVLAIMYLFMSVLLMAFAPLFFLIGIVPGQGKKIFLGWLEKVVSAILKYFACVLWMMVTVQLYGAVLGNSSGLGGTLIFVIIVTLAMMFYRKEFLGMIGKANFGGVQFSNRVGEEISKRAKKVGQVAALTGAGAAAGFVAGGGNGESYKGKNFADRVKTFGHNVADRSGAAKNSGGFTAMQQLKRGNGIVANGARSYDKIMTKRRGETIAKANDAAGKLRKTSDAVRSKNAELAADRDTRDFIKSNPNATKDQIAAHRQSALKGYTDNLESAKTSTAQLEATRAQDLGGAMIGANGQTKLTADGKTYTMTHQRRDDLSDIALKAYQQKATQQASILQKGTNGYDMSNDQIGRQLGLAGSDGSMSTDNVQALDDYRKNSELISSYDGRQLSNEDQAAVNHARRELSMNAVTQALNQQNNAYIDQQASAAGYADIHNISDVNNGISAADTSISEADTHYAEGVSVNQSISAVDELDRQATIAEKNASRMNRRRDSGSVHAKDMNNINASYDLANNIADYGGGGASFDDQVIVDEMANIRQGGGPGFNNRIDQHRYNRNKP